MDVDEIKAVCKDQVDAVVEEAKRATENFQSQIGELETAIQATPLLSILGLTLTVFGGQRAQHRATQTTPHIPRSA